MDKAHKDSEVIAALGGVTKLAKLLRLDKQKGGVQRVSNWRTRGIPPKVRLENPDVFGNVVSKKRTPEEQGA
jgi:hypothetical protein